MSYVRAHMNYKHNLDPWLDKSREEYYRYMNSDNTNEL